MSLPSCAVSDVNRSPVSCIPSPESPANRITTRSSCLTCLVTIWASLKPAEDTTLPSLRRPGMPVGPRVCSTLRCGCGRAATAAGWPAGRQPGARLATRAGWDQRYDIGALQDLCPLGDRRLGLGGIGDDVPPQ